MVTNVHELVGEMDCPSCSKPLPVKKTGTGKLSIRCRWCDYENYAVPGSIHFTKTMTLVRLAPPAAKPAPEAPPPAPVRKYAHER
jgi:hypothetical protein